MCKSRSKYFMLNILYYYRTVYRFRSFRLYVVCSYRSDVLEQEKIRLIAVFASENQVLGFFFCVVFCIKHINWRVGLGKKGVFAFFSFYLSPLHIRCFCGSQSKRWGFLLLHKKQDSRFVQGKGASWKYGI